MKKFYFYTLTLLSLASCGTGISDEEKYPGPTDPQKAFEKEFTDKYGTVSPDITWMTVSCDTIQADLSSLPAGEYAVKVFTANPCADIDYCYLLAEYNGISGGGPSDIVFDYPSGLNHVYVSVTAQDGRSYTAPIGVMNEEKKFVVDPDSAAAVMFDHKPMTYIIGYEGFTEGETSKYEPQLDFDYNDVVLGVEYVRGHDSATIKVLAAGCECAASVVYKPSANPDKSDDIILFEEAHKALGFEGVYDYMVKHLVYYALNTGINKGSTIGTTTLDLKDDINLPVSKLAQRLFVYFTILSEKSKDNKTSSSFIPMKPGAQYPQAVLVADPTWKWSREGMLLSAAYSQFRPWMYGPKGNELWYGADNWKEANMNFE